jgi:DNA-binding response OmpR family regulator
MPKVLLVDDSPLARHTVARRLEAEGFDVRAEATVAAVRTLDLDALACAAIDVDLPDGSGVDLAAEMHATHPSLPVAFFTASTEELDLAKKHGPVFRKPDVEALVAWVLGATGQPPPTK